MAKKYIERIVLSSPAPVQRIDRNYRHEVRMNTKPYQRFQSSHDCGWTPSLKNAVVGVEDQLSDVMFTRLRLSNLEDGYGTVESSANVQRKTKTCLGDLVNQMLEKTRAELGDLQLQIVREAFNLTAPGDETLLTMENRYTISVTMDTVDQQTGLIIHTNYDDRQLVNMSIVGRDPKVLQKTVNLFLELTEPVPAPVGRIHMMVINEDELEFKPLPSVVGCPLIPENYNIEVMHGYERVMEDLQSDNPRGRIAIFNGRPGTGKTYLLRSLLHELSSKTRFLFVAPSEVIKLTSPSSLPALMRFKGESPLPITLLIEDADEILAPRAGDNMSAVSQLLNLGDGLLGQALDLRLILTTNAKVKEFDHAVTRPGRLSANVTVGPLTPYRAKALYRKLKSLPETENLGNWPVEPEEPTLAEVYQRANDPDFQPVRQSKTIGF